MNNEQELENLALQRAAEGKSWRIISRELITLGIDPHTAKEVAKNVIKQPAWYGRQWFAVGLGLLMILASVGIFVSTEGGILAYGLFFVGLIRLISGLSKE